MILHAVPSVTWESDGLKLFLTLDDPFFKLAFSQNGGFLPIYSDEIPINLF